MEDDNNKLGCLGSRTSKKGKRYYRGIVNVTVDGKIYKFQVVCLHNRKLLPKHPDYNIYKAIDYIHTEEEGDLFKEAPEWNDEEINNN